MAWLNRRKASQKDAVQAGCISFAVIEGSPAVGSPSQGWPNSKILPIRACCELLGFGKQRFRGSFRGGRRHAPIQALASHPANWLMLRVCGVGVPRLRWLWAFLSLPKWILPNYHSEGAESHQNPQNPKSPQLCPKITKVTHLTRCYFLSRYELFDAVFCAFRKDFEEAG